MLLSRNENIFLVTIRLHVGQRRCPPLSAHQHPLPQELLPFVQVSLDQVFHSSFFMKLPNISSRAHRCRSSPDAVSWTDKSVEYFIYEVDRNNLVRQKELKGKRTLGFGMLLFMFRIIIARTIGAVKRGERIGNSLRDSEQGIESNKTGEPESTGRQEKGKGNESEENSDAENSLVTQGSTTLSVGASAASSKRTQPTAANKRSCNEKYGAPDLIDLETAECQLAKWEREVKFSKRKSAPSTDYQVGGTPDELWKELTNKFSRWKQQYNDLSKRCIR